MTPPTQSDARWEPPEWLVEKLSIWKRPMAGVSPWLAQRVRDEVAGDLRRALTECPVLGLTVEEMRSSCWAIDWQLRHGEHSIEVRTRLVDSKNKLKRSLLATREALERGGE